MSAAIQVQNLVKKYDSFMAVNDVSFTVEAGSVFAFLGTNGAGKSTTINCLTTTLAPSAGTLTVDGYEIGQDDAKIKQAIGVVFQASILDPLLTVRENLTYRAAFYGLKQKGRQRIDELSKLIDLTSFLDRPYGQLSGGQKRRADIARALLHSPKILFLDEPTAGLDAKSRQYVWNAIDSLRGHSGLTVFLTTHYLQETERADMVHIISAGVTVAQGTPQDLRARFSSSQLRIQTRDPQALKQELSKSKLSFTVDNDAFTIKVPTSIEALRLLRHHEKSIRDFEFQHGTMDEVFLALTESKKQ